MGCHSAWCGLLGLEPTIDLYVEHIVECFREVKRVLRDDGTLWLNLGSSYASSRPAQSVVACGNDDIGPPDSPMSDPSCSRSDGERQDCESHRTARTAQGLPVGAEHHDKISRDTVPADSASKGDGVAFPDVSGSTRLSSSCCAQDACDHAAKVSGVPSGIGSSSGGVHSSEDTTACRNDTARQSQTLDRHMSGIESSGSASSNLSQEPAALTLFYSTIAALNFKPKDLICQPHLVALALQMDGWFLRSDIIWSKVNPMPESVIDRPTRAHEYVFLLTKQPRYYYDAEAVREDGPTYTRRAGGYTEHHRQGASRFGGKGGFSDSDVTTTGRNKRSVWTIPTEANPEAHFASFPRRLVLPCVLAGTSEKGCCPECGAPWVRVVEKSGGTTGHSWHNHEDDNVRGQRAFGTQDGTYKVKTLGWCPGLDQCVEHPHPVPCTVLDPFVGSGQAGIVATQQGRKFIGIDASEEYYDMSRRRIADPEPELEIPDVEGQMMFKELEPEVNAVASRGTRKRGIS